jgi:hypothetical protein
MSTRIILIALYTTAGLALNGCAVYTAASVGSYAVTGKGLTDHGTSAITQGDCNTTHFFKDKYYCEMPVVYNRNGF